MPTYDYVCGACGHRIEVMHGVHDQGPTVCPNCHARAMRKAIVSPTILYKGSGWAKKDRGSSARTKAAAKADAADGGSSGAPTSTDSGASGPDKGSDKSSDKGSDRSDRSERADKSSGSSSASGSSGSGSHAAGGSTAPSKGD
jgi:putative FmdB family regulatory protein